MAKMNKTTVNAEGAQATPENNQAESQDASKPEVPHKNPIQGGSFIRHPDTGDLHPNADDHVMAGRAAAEQQES